MVPALVTKGVGMGRMIAAALAGLALAGLALATPAAADTRAGTAAWGRGEWKRAVGEWRAPATAGDADAQFNLGQAYRLGRGVPTDLVQAAAWYAKAAAQGHPLAIDDLGLLLFAQGRHADALPWLEKAAARDERRAEFVLGTMVFNGDAIGRDPTRSYALVTRASQQGLVQAGPVLAELDGYLTPEQRRRGTELAGRIAAQARTTGIARPALAAAAGSSAAAPPASLSAAAKAMPVVTPVPVVATARPKPVVTGRYRIQLGAFKQESNARALWSRVGGRTGGQPSYSRTGALTRLQAGPFASEADARRACRASGVTCVVSAR